MPRGSSRAQGNVSSRPSRGPESGSHGAGNVELVQPAQQHQIAARVEQSGFAIHSGCEKQFVPLDVPHPPRYAVLIGKTVIPDPEPLVKSTGSNGIRPDAASLLNPSANCFHRVRST